MPSFDEALAIELAEPPAPRILCIDIETTPNLAWLWQWWDENVTQDKLVVPVDILCFAAKWLGERKVEFHSNRDDEAMVSAAWHLLDEADAVMHYNGRRFDIPHLNREFVERGFGPPSPFQQIDLLAVVRSRFKFPSNKLSYVAPALGVGAKVKHEGFELWLKCMDGDEAAWKRMQRYNRQDVVLLEELYRVLQPWIPNHPALTLWDEGAGCPTCGADLDKIVRAGSYRTKTRKYRRYRCEECGSFFRSTRSERGVHLTGVS